MRRLVWIVLAVAAVLPLGANAQVSAQEGSETTAVGDLRVSVSLSEVAALTGERFTFTSEISNKGSDPSPALIANLNIVSLDQSAYIDPEDWSPQRFANVAPIEAGSSAEQTWTVNPVLKGSVAVYVVIVPESPDLAKAEALVSSSAIHLQIGEQRTLNPGGVLPVVLAVPGLLGLILLGLVMARRRG